MKIGETRCFIRITGVFGLLIIAAGCGAGKSSASGDPFAVEKFNPYDQELGKRIQAANQFIDAGPAH